MSAYRERYCWPAFWTVTCLGVLFSGLAGAINAWAITSDPPPEVDENVWECRGGSNGTQTCAHPVVSDQGPLVAEPWGHVFLFVAGIVFALFVAGAGVVGWVQRE